MRSAAEAVATVPERNPDPLEHVDYRLAETTEEKDEIFRLRYRAYLREGAVKESPAQRVTDQYDDLPNSWTFGVYVAGDLYSSVRISLLTSEFRQSCSAEAFGEILFPMLDQGKVMDIGPHRELVERCPVYRQLWLQQNRHMYTQGQRQAAATPALAQGD